jgi:DNA-binding transcriptional regulator YhcF (GntR family)
MQIRIDNASNRPVYRQIIDQSFEQTRLSADHRPDQA